MMRRQPYCTRTPTTHLKDPYAIALKWYFSVLCCRIVYWNKVLGGTPTGSSFFPTGFSYVGNRFWL